eukprot:scaffold9.g3021.t1
MAEVLRAWPGFAARTAIVSNGTRFTYAALVRAALAVHKMLQEAPVPRLVGCGGAALAEAAEAAAFAADAAADPTPRVAIMSEPGATFVASAFGSWLRRGIAVPLCLTHPDRELQYVLEDAGVSAVLASERHAEHMYRLARPLGAEVHAVDAAQLIGSGPPPAELPEEERREVESLLGAVGPGDGALIIYTSGTTGRPKGASQVTAFSSMGALHTHGSLAAQVQTLNRAWEWAPSDRILHCLPLHHVHGLVNALACPLAAGAAVEFLPKFSPSEVWHALQARVRREAAKAAAQLRLAVSGSAACPLPVMADWEQLSGQRLLERYGMTETGMILGNPYRGERRPGTVGQPFEGVEVRLVAEDSSLTVTGPGELRVRSPQLFKEYWGRPEATAEAFDGEGYFCTGTAGQGGVVGGCRGRRARAGWGDTAVLEAGVAALKPEGVQQQAAGQRPPAYYKLLGRTSISALDIESVLLEHPAIREVAVLGLPDPDYGELVAAVVGLAEQPGGGDGQRLSLKQLRDWAAEQLPKYQLPALLKVVPSIPRNAMAKINKKALRAELFPERVAG